MSKYIIRLDDASDYMDLEKWKRIESILDKYHVKPIFGIIPDNKDESLVSQYDKNDSFWNLMNIWIEKGWTPAMHGYEHRYVTEDGGINPVNKRSEFAGLPLDEQKKKIRQGHQILAEHNIEPEIFFAPSHTFDENTLAAIKSETSIRVISDTVANDVYKKDDFYFIPQQSGSVRALPFQLVTFCYHPNTMEKHHFEELENFLETHQEAFISYSSELLKDRKKNLYDTFLSRLYFLKHL